MSNPEITLASYNAAPEPLGESLGSRMRNEAFVSDWARYRRIADRLGVKRSLALAFPALHFPLGEKVSERDDYRTAVEEGIRIPRGYAFPPDSLLANHFDSLSWELRPTIAGRIPVLYCRARKDFEAFLQAVTMKNRPEPIPRAKGAEYIAGYVNRERLDRYRRKFLRENPAFLWPAEFGRLSENKDLYCDKFIVLSNSPYSGVPASAMGMGEDEWLEKSLVIRREHECMHYIARRMLRKVRNNALDEIVADAAGMLAALDGFKAAHLLLFLGIDDEGRLSEDGRLRLYRSSLKDRDFDSLVRMTVRAASKLEILIRNESRHFRDSRRRTGFLLKILCAGMKNICT